MIDVSKLDNVLDDIQEGAGFDAMTDDAKEEFMKEIENSTVMGLMDRYLQWHGIVNYTEQILTALETICEADSNNPAHLCAKLVAYNWDDEQKSYEETYGEHEDIISHAADQEGEPHIFCVLARLHLLTP